MQDAYFLAKDYKIYRSDYSKSVDLLHSKTKVLSSTSESSGVLTHRCSCESPRYLLEE